MHPPPHTHLDLSEAEAAALQRYADQHGMSLDEAATELARQAIQSRYVRRKPQAQVLPFKPRA